MRMTPEATSEATIRDDRSTSREPIDGRRSFDRRLPGSGRSIGAAVVVAVALLGGLGGCKTSPHADGGDSSKSSKAPDPWRGGGAQPAPSAEEARLERVDATIKQWDAAHAEARDDAASALARKISDEVDRDFPYFATASKGEKGLKIQNLAVQALAFSGNRAATTLLVDRLRDLDGSVVGNALIGLKIRSDPDTPLKPLIALLRAQFPEARRYAPLALANVVRAREVAHRPIEPELSDAAMAGLVGLVQDNDPYARLHAAKAMGALRRPDATDFLVMLLQDVRATIRIAAAAALERIGDPRSFPSVVALLDRMADDQQVYVREILVSYAERLQGRPMTPVEVKALDVSPRAWDRWFAARQGTPKAPATTAK